MRGSTRHRARLATGAALLLVASLAGPARAAVPQVYVVDDAGDAGGTTCASPCTLRQAITAANLNAPAHDTIVFAIPGGPADIAPGAALPAITDAVTVDGTTQPGTRVVGAAAGAGVHGFHVLASATVIRGLEIREFGGNAVHLDSVAGAVIGGEDPGQGNVLAANGGDAIALGGDASAVGNRFATNLMFANGGLPIDIGDDGFVAVGGPVGDVVLGPNAYQHAPQITGPLVGPVTSVEITAAARPSVGQARVEVYWGSSCPASALLNSARAQAEEYLGFVDIALATAPAGSTGSATFVLPAPKLSGYLSAHTTTSDGTSEIAGCRRIGVPTDLSVSASSSPAGVVDVGDPVTLNVTVTNDGPADHGGVLLGLGLNGGDATIQSVTPSQGSCEVQEPAAICDVGPVVVGASATVQMVLVPTVAGFFDVGAIILDDEIADLDPDDNQVLLALTVAATEDVADDVLAGQSLTTDLEADGATPTDPLETTVIVPFGATVSIGERTTADPPPAGYQFFGQAAVIEVNAQPVPTAANPIVLQFLLDGGAIPAAPLVVFRNGVPVPACTVADPGTDPSAAPDPCVLPTSMVGDDLLVTVRTSAASTWRFGTELPYDFHGFFAPVDNDGVLNKVKAGAAVPLKFSLGGDRGLGIFAAGSPASTGHACGGPVDPVEQTVTAGSSSLSYDPASDRYHYVWKTSKSWAGTCRQLTLTFDDGSTATALFQFTR